MEVKPCDNPQTQQLGVFATKAYAVGDVICKEKAPLIRLAPVGNAQEAALVAALHATKRHGRSSPGSSPAPKTASGGSPNSVNSSSHHYRPKESLWQAISVPPDVPGVYHGTFKGMVQAGLSWAVLVCSGDNDDEEDRQAREAFLKLYAPSLDKHSREEAVIVDVAQKAVHFLTDHGVRTNHSQAKDDQLLSVVLIWACNSFEQGRVYKHISRFNHSCNPNAVVQPIPDGVVSQQDDGQRIVAAAAIAVGEEICISYLGLFLYAERSVRQQHLQQTKHFVCACTRCGSSDSDESSSEPDRAAIIPCLQCHVRIGRQLDEDTQYDDDQKVNYMLPRIGPDGVVTNSCDSCKTTLLETDEACANVVKAGKKVIQKTVTFLQDYDRSRGSHPEDKDDDDEELEDEMLDQHIRMASSVLGAKHWTTNILLLLQVDRNLQTLHGSMMFAADEDKGDSKSSSTPDLDSIAATVDSLERIVRFVQGLQLKLHMGHLVGDVVIGLARALVVLGDKQSQTYAAEWLDKIATDYVDKFASSGLQKVVGALRTAWQQHTDSEDDAKPRAKKLKT